MEEGQVTGVISDVEGHQRTMKAAKIKHLSDIVISNNPCVLFKTVNSVLNVPHSACLENSTEVYERFLSLFKNKVASIRVSISPSSYDLRTSVTRSAVFDQFEAVPPPILI